MCLKYCSDTIKSIRCGSHQKVPTERLFICDSSTGIVTYQRFFLSFGANNRTAERNEGTDQGFITTNSENHPTCHPDLEVAMSELSTGSSLFAR